jgi:hypothetical protein
MYLWLHERSASYILGDTGQRELSAEEVALDVSRNEGRVRRHRNGKIVMGNRELGSWKCREVTSEWAVVKRVALKTCCQKRSWSSYGMFAC